MAREWFIPGYGMINEDDDQEWFVPEYGMIDEDQAAGGEVAPTSVFYGPLCGPLAGPI